MDQHDITKQILQKIRENTVPKQLRFLAENGYETAADSQNPTSHNPNEGDNIQPSQEELTQEHQRFREVVGPRVEFTMFNIYPQAGNVVFGGKFQDMDGLEWQFTLEETDGLYITVNNMQVSDDVVTRIQKLRGYYDNWAGDWSNKLATEYKGK